MIRSSAATATRRRAEVKVIKSVREQVMARDQGCRVRAAGLAACWGDLQWAHLHEHARSKTRRMKATERHTTAGTLALCALHHHLYDRHEFAIQCLSERGCDGPIKVTDDGRTIYEES